MLDSNSSIGFNENTKNDVNHSNQTFDLFSRMSTRKSLDAQHQGFSVPKKNFPHLIQLLNEYLLMQEFNTFQFMMDFINKWYPIIIAFIALLYSVGLGLTGDTEGAQYSAHWPGTILLFAIAIRQRRLTNSKDK